MIYRKEMLSSYQNPCSSNPCLHNATCLNGFTDKRYICLCQAGYTGENCETAETGVGNFIWTFVSDKVSY